MKLEVTKYIEQKEMVDIELPYYFKTEYCGEYDSETYGKIEETRCTIIKISPNYGTSNYELIIEDRPATTCGGYMKAEDKSNEAEYLKAKARLLALAQAA